MIEREAGMQVVGEAATGVAALELIEALRPDIAVLDLMLPEMHGIQLTAELRKAGLLTKVVMLSMFTNTAYVANALQAGAAAYVLKGSNSSELLRAIRDVSAGHVFLSPPLNERALAEYYSYASRSGIDLYETLTKRERQILSLAAHGLTSLDCGRRLRISPRTVEVHRANLMRKLNLANQSELLRFAVGRGILLPDEPDVIAPATSAPG